VDRNLATSFQPSSAASTKITLKTGDRFAIRQAAIIATAIGENNQ